jgi:hypothetical protein
VVLVFTVFLVFQGMHKTETYTVKPFYEMMEAAGYDPDAFTVLRSEQIFQPESNFIKRYDSLTTLDPALAKPGETFIEHNNLVYFRYMDSFTCTLPSSLVI